MPVHVNQLQKENFGHVSKRILNFMLTYNDWNERELFNAFKKELDHDREDNELIKQMNFHDFKKGLLNLLLKDQVEQVLIDNEVFYRLQKHDYSSTNSLNINYFK